MEGTSPFSKVTQLGRKHPRVEPVTSDLSGRSIIFRTVAHRSDLPRPGRPGKDSEE